MTRPEPVDARAVLADLGHRLGRTGLAAAACLPALLAAVDQHAAEIRDRLTDGVRQPGPIALAGYVDGLCATAATLGWSPPTAHKMDWTRAPWLVLRLLAVCLLAEGSVQ